MNSLKQVGLSGDSARAGDEALIILQSLLCLMREKNLLTRADIQELCEKVSARVADHAADPLPCCAASAASAADHMARIGGYIGQRYGGKHRKLPF